MYEIYVINRQNMMACSGLQVSSNSNLSKFSVKLGCHCVYSYAAQMFGCS